MNSLKNGKFIDNSGTQRWYKNGLLHREDEPVLIAIDGHKAWYLEGRLYRENGPAVIYSNGCQEWVKDSMIHREDGPARIWPNGEKEYWVNNELCTKEKWWDRLSNEAKLKAIFNGEGVWLGLRMDGILKMEMNFGIKTNSFIGKMGLLLFIMKVQNVG